MKAAKPIRRNGTLHIKRRVPARFRSVENREFVWISLHTDSEEVAAAKVPAIWNSLIEAWEARLIGADTAADGRMEAAKNLAAKRGFAFMPAVEVAKLPLAQLLTRIEATLNRKVEIDQIEAEALLGGAQPSPIRLADVLDHYWRVARDKTLNKSAAQLRCWRNPRIKAVQAFTAATGNKAIADITTADVQSFRSKLVDRMLAGDLDPGSVSKDMLPLLGG